jgi:hypothetical protein
MVTNLDKMMISRLELFKIRNKNALPQRVLVYRDGVSEVSVSLFCRLGVLIQADHRDNL